MKKIGLIGEDPNDTSSIRNLLAKKYLGKFQFKQLIRNKKGYQLNNSRVEAALKVEFEDYRPDHVIFIRDADAIETEIKKIKRVTDWFDKLNPIVGNRGILLLNIYELEALILADIETFNRLYNVAIKYSKNVMFQPEPKEFLIKKTRKTQKTYTESHAPAIFEHLNIDVLISKCMYFKIFCNILDDILAKRKGKS